MFSKKDTSEETITAPVQNNVVTINVYEEKQYVFKDDLFQSVKSVPTFNTSNFIISFVSNKDTISTSVNISRSIPEEDIPDILDIKAYEELGLDQAKQYVISSAEVDDGGEERTFHIFVAEAEVLDDFYIPIKQETKYLDLILPEALLYRGLYLREILADKHTHCFVYFTEYDATVTIYHKGAYLYCKSIDFSLMEIYDRYCELIGEKIDEKEFFTVLESEGLKTTHTDYQQNFMKIFGEVFITINDIIIYAKRAFKLTTIDQMFIGSDKGPIIGLDDYSQSYLGLHSTDFNFNYNIANEEWYTDQLQYMMLLNAFEFDTNPDSFVNLSTYYRPPSFVNRASGQFIISTFAAISLSLAYPLVYLVGSYVNDAAIYALEIEDKKLQKEAKKYKKILAEKKRIKDGLDKEVKKYVDRYEGKTKTLTAIYNKKVKYRLKSGILYNIAEELNQFDVHIDMLKSNNDELELSLVSEDDRTFTEVIHFISNKHFDEIVDINIEKIEKDTENNYYKGLLKVKLNEISRR